MAIGPPAGGGDSAFSIIKPRVPSGLRGGKSVIKYRVSYALVIEALIEAGLDEFLKFQEIFFLHTFYNELCIEARFEAGLEEPQRHQDCCVSHTFCYELCTEALIEAGLSEVLILQAITRPAYVLQ